jgi:hypothetical protein
VWDIRDCIYIYHILVHETKLKDYFYWLTFVRTCSSSFWLYIRWWLLFASTHTHLGWKKCHATTTRQSIDQQQHTCVMSLCHLSVSTLSRQESSFSLVRWRRTHLCLNWADKSATSKNLHVTPEWLISSFTREQILTSVCVRWKSPHSNGERLQKRGP